MTDSRHRLDSLTGLRFFAAFLVLQHHFTNFGMLPWLDRWTGFGVTGVSFFFVLSGFVLTWSRPVSDTARRFYWRRFARIWPLHAACTLLALPVFYGLRHQPSSIPAIALTLVLLQSWVPVATIFYAGNPAAWTLSCEAFFYALHPAVAKRWMSLTAGSLARLATLVAIGMLVVAIAVDIETSRLPVSVRFWALEIAPAYRVGEFLLGVALALALRRGVRLPVRPLPAVLLLAAWFGFYYEAVPSLGTRAAEIADAVGRVAVPLGYAALIAAAAQRDLAGVGSWLRSPLMVRLGAWSYALYLTHATVIYTLIAIAGTRPTGWSNLPWLLATAAVCVLLSGVLYEFLERPIERRLRAMAGERGERLEAYAR